MRKRASSSAGVKNVVVISDLHCGCQLGLLDGPIKLDEGSPVLQSRLQKIVWGWWQQFWGEVVPGWVKGEPYCVVVNGDIVDGVHHGSTTQISHNLTVQCKIAERILKPVRDKCDGRFYMVRGTEAHVGKSAQEEEALATRLEAIPNQDGQHARWALWKKVNGGLVQFMHHVGTTSSSAHESSAVNAELAASYTDAGRWGYRPPDIIVRSHRHRCIEVRLPSRNGYASSFVTAGWQLKTPFSFKIAGGRVATPQFGGSLIRQGDQELHTRHWVKDIQPDEAE